MVGSKTQDFWPRFNIPTQRKNILSMNVSLSEIEHNFRKWSGSKISAKNGILLPKLFWPTVRKNCSSDLKNFATSRPSASNFKSFSWSLEHFFLTVGQNNFGNKIPCFPYIYYEIFKCNRKSRQNASVSTAISTWPLAPCYIFLVVISQGSLFFKGSIYKPNNFGRSLW